MPPPKLFPYQEEGRDWLVKRSHALLADEPGLGKTAQVITALDKLNLQKILILCPAVARINWAREMATWSIHSRNVSIIEGRNQHIVLDGVVISSYDLADRAPSGEWDLLVLDESHFLKSLATKRTRLVFATGGIAHRSKRIWALSGTPAPNHAGELWVLLYTFGVTPLKYEDYVKRYCTYYIASFGRTITGTNQENTPELRRMLDKIMRRKNKIEVMKQLSPISYQTIIVPPGKVDLEMESSFIQYVFPQDRRKLLQDKLNQELSLVKSVIKISGFRNHSMATLEGIYRSVSTLRRYMGVQKVEAVEQLVKSELENKAYKKVVIFGIHRDVINGLRERLKSFGAVTLYGGSPPEARQKAIDDFQTKARCKVFIGNIQACGTAITLTAGHHVIFVEQSWVPGDNAQATMRCHRIGQQNTVFVRFVALANSFEENLTEILKRKTRQLTRLFDEPILEEDKEEEETNAIDI
ncbi:chromatin remodeling complex ATPase-like protein [Caudoviricetes sp.]|nr:chromatin remodeling complex ATPase-like protein [Caudoviricetes sp.]